jgi:hypothetical protein
MNLQAISSAVHTAMLPEAQKALPAPAAAPSKTASPTDTVSLSSTARPGSAGDVDHDGDSH